MKKLTFTFILFIICSLLFGCASKQKPSATEFNSKYSTKVFSIWDRLNSDIENAKTSEDDKVIVKKMNETYLPDALNLSKEIEKENTQPELRNLKIALINYNNSLINFIKISSNIFLESKVSPISEQKILSAFTQLFEQRLLYDNEYSLVTSGKSSFELTLENYKKIQIGDKYSTVIKTFKMPGKLSNSYTRDMPILGKRTLDTYEWELNSGHVKIMFENGRVHMMEQRNLR